MHRKQKSYVSPNGYSQLKKAMNTVTCSMNTNYVIVRTID